MKCCAFGTMFLLSLFFIPAFVPEAGAEEEGWLGVEVQDLSESLMEALDYGGSGVLVNEVIEESPAAAAGIKVGDIIETFNGQQIEDLRSFVDLVRDTAPGTTVSLGIWRKGEEKQLEAQIEGHERLRPEFPGKMGKQFKRFHFGREVCLGVRIEDLTQELGEYFATDEGALVMSVREEGPGAKAGMLAGDVIKEMDGARIHDVRDVFEILDHKEKGDQVQMKVLRKGTEQSLTVTLEGCEEMGMHWWSSPEGSAFSHGPGGCFILPDPGKIELNLEELEESIESGELGRRIERELEVFGDLSGEKLQDLEKSLQKLEEEVAKLKEKIAD